MSKKREFTPKYIHFTNNKDLVKVGCSYAGKMYYGLAKCSPEDEFDIQKGYNLAKARCDVAIYQAKVKRSHDKIISYGQAVNYWDSLLKSELKYEQELYNKLKEYKEVCYGLEKDLDVVLESN